MPKMKTRKGIKKRFKLTAKGKIKRFRNYSNHLFTSKSPKRKRGLRKPALVHSSDVKRIKRALPYG
jgi:large subunit ribosomal protein L35